MEKILPENYDFVECRSVGHAWTSVKAEKSPAFGAYVWFQCTRCNMLRMDTINFFGHVAARSYRQPEGYKNPEIKDRSEYRKELIRRIFDTHEIPQRYSQHQSEMERMLRRKRLREQKVASS